VAGFEPATPWEAAGFPWPAAAIDEPKYQLRRFNTGEHPADLFRWRPSSKGTPGAKRLTTAVTRFDNASCGTIRLKFMKIGALVRISVRRIKIAMASGCPTAAVWGDAAIRLNAAASARGSPV
jgi:hypothetical protein